MPLPQPPSIFANPPATNPPETSTPATPPKPPSSPLPTRQPIWATKVRLDLGDSISRPFSGPLHSLVGGRGGSTGAVRTPPAVAGKKRPLTPTDDGNGNSNGNDNASTPATEPLHKRRRLQTRSRHSLHSLDPFHFPKSAPQFQINRQPPSPLFFSSRSPRPHLPPRFSSSEAAARMLSKTRGEDGGIKTVTLARGTFNGLSPPGPMSVASGRSSERSSMPRTASPDARDRTDPLRLLGSVGIVELLEQDTRPTFIVDIGDSANYVPESPTLQILFANSALRSSSSTWALVVGAPPELESDEAVALATNQFRNWLLSTVLQGANPDVNPSPVEHGGVIWSCYTLRKRLRVVSGAVPTHATASITPASGPHEFSIPSTSSAGLISGNSILVSSSSIPQSEPQDYFGSTRATAAEKEPLPPHTAVRKNSDDTARDSSPDVSGIFPNSSNISYPSIENTSSFNNECVLRAHSAGDVDPFHREPSSPKENDMGFFDWTRLPISSSLPRHIQFARAVDWATTPLGPIEYWSNDLRAMCNLIM